MSFEVEFSENLNILYLGHLGSVLDEILEYFEYFLAKNIMVLLVLSIGG